MSKNKRKHRTPEQMIADLQAEIVRVKERAERAKAKRDPALRHVTAAVRSIDKALAATTDAATKTGLSEARATLAACLAINAGGKNVLTPVSRSVKQPVEPAAVLTYLKSNPGSSGEQVAEALGTDTQSLRSVMKQLIADGDVKSKGKARGTKYAPA